MQEAGVQSWSRGAELKHSARKADEKAVSKQRSLSPNRSPGQRAQLYILPKVMNGHYKNIPPTWNFITWCEKAEQPSTSPLKWRRFSVRAAGGSLV